MFMNILEKRGRLIRESLVWLIIALFIYGFYVVTSDIYELQTIVKSQNQLITSLREDIQLKDGVIKQLVAHLKGLIALNKVGNNRLVIDQFLKEVGFVACFMGILYFGYKGWRFRTNKMIAANVMAITGSANEMIATNGRGFNVGEVIGPDVSQMICNVGEVISPNVTNITPPTGNSMEISSNVGEIIMPTGNSMEISSNVVEIITPTVNALGKIARYGWCDYEGGFVWAAELNNGRLTLLGKHLGDTTYEVIADFGEAVSTTIDQADSLVPPVDAAAAMAESTAQLIDLVSHLF